METELATAYISLIPELKGAGKSIASQLGGVDVAPTGRKLGKSLSDGISSGIDSSGIRQLENAVANASQKVGRAMASEKDATNQLKIAQQRLIEVRSKYADGSSQVMAAEAKVENAQRKATSASERTKSAQVELKRAQEQLSSANKKVSSSSDDASRGISSMGKAAGSIKGALSTLAKVAGPIIAAVGFGQLVSEAAAATDATQKFKSTLDFAGLGSSEIEALSKSTRKYADETVYSLSDIQGITAQLAANSVKDYDRLAEAAGNLNAVAGGNAETFESVGMVMTQTAGAGKLTTENWNQLADAIPGASGKLQEAMLKNGAYTGNFRKAMEQGQISAEEFNQAIMQLGFEDAAVEAAKSTKTFEGAIGNLQAAVVGGLSDALAKLQPFLTGAINGITSTIEPAFSAINSALGSVIQGLMDFGTQIAPVFQPVADAFMRVGEALQPVMSQVQSSLLPSLSQIGTAVGSLMTALAPLIAMIVSTVGPYIAQIMSFIVSLATTIATNLAPVIQGIADLITAAMPIIQTIWTTAMTAMQGVITAVWPIIQTIVTTAMGVIQSIISIVTAAISGDWSGVWEGIKSLFSTIWEGIKSAAQSGIDTVYNTVTGIKDKILGFFSGAGGWLVGAGKSILNGLLDGLKSAWGGVTGFIGGIGDWIVSHKGPPSYDAVMLKGNGELIMRGLLDGLQSGWPDVQSYVSSRNLAISASAGIASRRSALNDARTGVVNNYYIDKLQLTAGDKAEAERVFNIISNWERLARA